MMKANKKIKSNKPVLKPDKSYWNAWAGDLLNPWYDVNAIENRLWNCESEITANWYL
jgi:hypothetical protein